MTIVNQIERQFCEATEGNENHQQYVYFMYLHWERLLKIGASLETIVNL